MAELPAPKPYWYISVFNVLMDGILQNAAPDIVFAQLSIAVPWLANPITRWFVGQIFVKVDERVKIVGDKGLLQIGGQYRKMQFDQMIQKLKDDGNVSDDDLQKIKDAADDVIHHGS